jgi:CRP-like cAMP-binding protein
MPYKALYIITDGYCIGEMTDDSGKVLKIEDFPAPYTLASALLFADDNRMPVTVWAKTETNLLILSHDAVLTLCRTEEQFMENLLKDLANKFTFLSTKLTYLQFKSLQEKIIYYLSGQQKDDSGYVELRQSIRELSSLFGVERPSLSRALIRMENEGIIERDGKRVKVISD